MLCVDAKLQIVHGNDGNAQWVRSCHITTTTHHTRVRVFLPSAGLPVRMLLTCCCPRWWAIPTIE